MGAINEFIKAIRTQHTIMVGFCTILIVFALNAKTESGYTVIIDELTKVDSALTIDSYHIIDSLLIVRADSTQRVHQTENGGVIDISEAFVSRSVLISRVPDRSWTIQEIREFVQSENRIYTAAPYLSAEQMYAILDTVIAIGDTLKPMGLDFNFNNLEKTKKKTESTTKEVSRFYEYDGSFRAIPDFSLYAELYDFNIYWVIKDVKSKVPNVEDKHLGFWWYKGIFLPETEAGEDLLAETFFGCGECYGMTVSEALQYILEKQKSTEQKVTALGLDLHGASVFYVGPLILIALIIYLWIMAYNLHAYLHKRSSVQDVFPWFGIVNNRLSRLAVFVSIVLLPSVTLWVVWMKALHGFNLLTAAYALLNLFTLAISIFCFLSLVSVGKHISISHTGNTSKDS